MKIKSSSLLPAFLLLILICPTLSAQQTTSTASVTIVVTDQEGAAVPHALIKLFPSPSTISKDLETGNDGKFSLNMAPGNYELSVTNAGFRAWTKNIQLQDAANLSVNVVLTVAQLGGMIVYAAHFDGQTWWNHIKVLADDKLEGRDTGSRGEREAQKYAIAQLKNAGAEPAGSDGFYQPVKFVSRQIVEKDCSLVLIRDGKREPLTLGEDAIITTRVMPAPEVEASLVFAGYGLKVPEKNYDDFAGLDVKGKLVVVFSGSPAEIPGALASHYQTLLERWKVLKAAGAVGMISLLNPAVMDIPWSRISLNRAHPSMDLDYPEFDETAGAKLMAFVNPASAEKFFAGSGHTFQEIAALGKDRKPLPRFPLTVSIAAKTKVEVTQVESANLVAKLPGNDSALKDEYVVLSAHLDHIGIGEPINGDRIYNGAMDNGSGSALVLDMADSFKKHPEKLRRSLLLVLVTGEEKGLLGSKYFAAHPTVPAKSMVADVNVDMFLPIVPLKVLRVLGLDDSDLGDRTREIAQSEGVKVQPDPEPLRNLFIRSDQYNFIRHGVPSVIMSFGAEPGSPEQKTFKDWLTQRYHAPSDDVNQPVDLAAAAKYEEIIRGLLINVANGDHRPQWKPESFFRRYAEPAKIGAITIPEVLRQTLINVKRERKPRRAQGFTEELRGLIRVSLE
jgi:peptidase M28-like protein/carboxypeptidase family protein